MAPLWPTDCKFCSVPSELHLDLDGLGRLVQALRQRSYQVIGPTVKDGAIAFAPIETVRDLPAGWTAIQEPGRYRLDRRNDDALFGFANPSTGLKPFLYPPEVKLCEIRRENFAVSSNDEPAPRYAFLGVRGCDLAAVRVQDRALLEDRYPDRVYAERRRACFIVAVHCAHPAATCFCTSMGTGPRASGVFDLALTELAGHDFVLETGSQQGEDIARELHLEEASPESKAQARELTAQAARRISKRLDTTWIRELLQQSFESKEWDRVAQRCLACANCTMVCPTCFCSQIEDSCDVGGTCAERHRQWDSCFTLQFTHIHKGSVRQSTRARYRQWLTHKLSYWIDQFGSSGCVGCGRCITWCPAGIDITEEVKAIRAEATL